MANPFVLPNHTDTRTELQFSAMGTDMHLIAYGNSSSKVVQQSKELIVQLDELWSLFRHDSELSYWNKEAHTKWKKVHRHTARVLQDALYWAKQTNGAYDPALGAFSIEWKKAAETGVLPQSKAPKHPPFQGIHRFPLTDCYRLEQDVLLDFGGIAKGYACDRILEFCRKEKGTHGLFSLGGSSVAAVGTRPGGNPWRVGLQIPMPGSQEFFGVLSLTDSMLSVSGDYQRFFSHDNQRFHHLLNPQTGLPTQGDFSSVTVVAQSGTAAEALSTALFVMGHKKAKVLYSEQKNFEAVFVTTDQTVFCTPNIREQFEFCGRAAGFRPGSF